MNRIAIAPVSSASSDGRKLRVYSSPDVEDIAQLARIDPEIRDEMKVVAKVLPFRVNAYVVEELINWDDAPDDPIFRLVFPSRSMLDANSFDEMAFAFRNQPAGEQHKVAAKIRARLNPHPADQMSLNRPLFEGQQIPGIQHKYPETVLFFPSDGQTCHSYCTFCFRWAQFVSDKDLRIAMSDRSVLSSYLREHPEVSDLLITGGDAFTVKARRLHYFLEPLMGSELKHVTNIRFATKALSFWPYRFLTDPDSNELIELLSRLVDCGKQVAIMAHYNHWRELRTDAAEEAIAKLRATGAVLRTQGPLLRGINDHPDVWRRLWKRQVELGMVPYYMFVARDTGAKSYFDVPLGRAWEIYAEAIRGLSGLARTVRGPSMSTSPGKIEILGISNIGEQRVFVLRFLQARNPEWAYRPFFAKFDENATWFDELKPSSEAAFFFETHPNAERRCHSCATVE